MPCVVPVRDALAGVPAYSQGKTAVAPAGRPAYKLSSNENPYPPLPSVLRVIDKVASDVNRYPDMSCSELIATLSRALGVPGESIAVGPGSSGVLGQVVQALCDPGHEVIYAWRSFEAYPIVVQLAGAASVQVPLDDDFRHRLDAMADAITERTRLVIVCTPNNPTGPAVTPAELRTFLDRVPPTVAVLVDEAYREFVVAADEARVDGVALIDEYPNVIALRTFSKAYGLAGLRVGYAVARPDLALAIRKTAIPFGVSSIGQAAAVASLDLAEELMARVSGVVAERARIVSALAEQGWRLPETQANFVYFPVGERTGEFAAACAAAGLAVRPFGVEGVRASIGEPAANDLLLTVAGAFLDAADPSGTSHP